MDTKENILIVDDEIPALESLAMIVEEVRPRAQIHKSLTVPGAIKIAKEHEISIAMLDINMPGGANGLELAKALKMINPRVNIIFVTAYDEYAYKATELFISGYLLKPCSKESVENQLSNLRFPIVYDEKKLRIQCFGDFEVFSNEAPLHFTRSRSKEVLAYLVDRRGASVGTGQIEAVIFADEEIESEAKAKSYIRVLLYELGRSLQNAGYPNVLLKQYNAYAVNVSEIECDYYKFLEKDIAAVNSFTGEYMSQYSWAEMTLGLLLDDGIE